MSESEAESVHPIVPPGELRCVWMSAGVLSYQLCERKLDCEQCPLDVALRQRFIEQQSMHGQGRAVIEARSSEQPRREMHYGRKHMWVSAVEDHRVQLGLEPGFTSILLSPKAVVLPSIGELIVCNKVCAWIVLDGGTLPIVSPISGKVCETNTYLAENPHAICSSPLVQGWLFELMIEGPVRYNNDLLSVADAAQIYAEDGRRFQALLSAEFMKGGADVGTTLADGGEALENLSEMLGPSKYFKLVRKIYT
jgi:glycine cleavage system H lipoate-binding protein